MKIRDLLRPVHSKSRRHPATAGGYAHVSSNLRFRCRTLPERPNFTWPVAGQGHRRPRCGPMTTAVSRWEWRTFGGQFGDIDDHLGAPTDQAESEELYLLSPTGENVKI